MKVKFGEWISCNEKLPPNTDDDFYTMNIVTFENGDIGSGVYRYDDKAWYSRLFEGEKTYRNGRKVIAWMPLPEPYKGGNE